VIGSRSRLALVAFLALAAAACSPGAAAPTGLPGGATAPPIVVPTLPVTSINPGTANLPCAAMEADVTAARGKALQVREYVGDTCSYTFGDSPESPLGGAILVRLENAGSTDFTAMKIAFPGGDDVSGLGDAAYWAPSPSVMYAAFHGNTYAVQLVLFDTVADPKGMATKTMEALLSRL
jgi:hypothetical protein